MGDSNLESGLKRELDDSGCVEDGSPPKKLGTSPPASYVGQAQLLDLSDDVLLFILKYCSPQDLKALGFSCKRLGALVLERSLWYVLDARGVQCGRRRADWLLRATHDGTREVHLTGLASLAHGCLGHITRTRKEAEEDRAKRRRGGLFGDGDNIGVGDAEPGTTDKEPDTVSPPLQLPNNPSPSRATPRFVYRMSSDTSLMDEEEEEAQKYGADCFGPQFTLVANTLTNLRDRCPHLTSLSLNYFNINCFKTSMAHFPASLKKLSLRGSRCYNLSLDKSFLFKIHDYLPLLEELDLSECEWLEPAALLPLSKMGSLLKLMMQDCPGMTEFVAYVSLATRYGFRKLKLLDFRGSPVGDSEVSALGWLPQLEELYLCAPRPPRAPRPPHQHYRGDALPTHCELDAWETEEPDYYKERPTDDSSLETSIKEEEEEMELMRDNSSMPTEQLCIEVRSRPPAEPRSPENRNLNGENTQKRPHENDAVDDANVPGPSKRNKPDDQPTRGDDCKPSCSKDVDNVRENNVGDENDEVGGNRNDELGDNRNEEGPANVNDAGPADPHAAGPANPNAAGPACPNAARPAYHNAVGFVNRHDRRARNDRRGHRNFAGAANPNDPNNELHSHIRIRYKGPCIPSYSVKININNGMIEELNGDDNGVDNDDDNPNENENQNENPNQNQEANPNQDDAANNDRPQRFIRLGNNEDPVVVPREEVEPRHHVLYVNVGQQLHAVYRLIPNRPIFRPMRHSSLTAERLSSSLLVTDSAIFRFGRAVGENVNVVHIGPNGPQVGGRDVGGRPNRSNLRILSVTGYRGITNRSLVHLATAAPNLHLIDFSNSSITEAGVVNFKSIRPDCEVRYSPFKNEE